MAPICHTTPGPTCELPVIPPLSSIRPFLRYDLATVNGYSRSSSTFSTCHEPFVYTRTTTHVSHVIPPVRPNAQRARAFHLVLDAVVLLPTRGFYCAAYHSKYSVLWQGLILVVTTPCDFVSQELIELLPFTVNWWTITLTLARLNPVAVDKGNHDLLDSHTHCYDGVER